jgi:DNA-binding NarL/FixJ family response regulator
MASSPLRVLIAEDQYLTREGTRRLLDERDEIDVVGVASDLDSVLAEARRLCPDVLLMDIKMPPNYSMEGIEAAHMIDPRIVETLLLGSSGSTTPTAVSVITTSLSAEPSPAG